MSLFINPNLEDVEKSLNLGVNAIELHTGHYAEASDPQGVEKELNRLKRSAHLGSNLQLKVFAGHGLHYENIVALVKILEIQEYNIGHSIIARSVFVGLDQAVKEIKRILASG